jgi:hypothetical protein
MEHALYCYRTITTDGRDTDIVMPGMRDAL